MCMPPRHVVLVSAYLYSNASLSFQVHEVHGGSDLVLPFHLQTETDRQTDSQTASQTDRQTDRHGWIDR